MELFLDLMIGAGAFLAAAYCMLLSHRLRKLTRLDGDVGKAIAILSQQVDALTAALQAAEMSNKTAGAALADQITKGEATARQLELLLAAHGSFGARGAAPKANAGPDDLPIGPAASQGNSNSGSGLSRRRVLRQREPQGSV